MKLDPGVQRGLLTIQGTVFTIPRPFNAGHICTAGEAKALNQTLAENTRNNYNDRVKKALRKATDEAPFDHTEIQAEIDEYLKTYEFGVRRGRGPADPVEREAFLIGKEFVKAALRKKSLKISDYSTEEINQLASEAVTSNQAISEEAKRRVARSEEIGDVEIDLSSLGSQTSKPVG